jgi:hypothetical protein
MICVLSKHEKERALPNNNTYTMTTWAESVAEMKSLEDNWLDGSGHKPSEKALAKLELMSQELQRFEVPILFPMDDGGVEVTWPHKLYLFVDAVGNVNHWDADKEKFLQVETIPTDALNPKDSGH